MNKLDRLIEEHKMHHVQDFIDNCDLSEDDKNELEYLNDNNAIINDKRLLMDLTNRVIREVQDSHVLDLINTFIDDKRKDRIIKSYNKYKNRDSINELKAHIVFLLLMIIMLTIANVVNNK